MPSRANRRVRLPIASALVLLCAASGFHPAVAVPQKQKKTATLSGIVYRGDKQRPVTDALIVLTAVQIARGEETKIRVEARSDASGAYRFDEVVGARYQVTIRTEYESEDAVPCKLRPAKSKDPDSLVIVIEEDGKFIEKLLIAHFPIKAGKPLVKDFDLECQSVFARDEVRK